MRGSYREYPMVRKSRHCPALELISHCNLLEIRWSRPVFALIDATLHVFSRFGKLSIPLEYLSRGYYSRS